MAFTALPRRCVDRFVLIRVLLCVVSLSESAIALFIALIRTTHYRRHRFDHCALTLATHCVLWCGVVWRAVVLAHMLLRQRSLKARGTAAVDDLVRTNPLTSFADAVGDLVDGAKKSSGKSIRSTN